MSIRIFYSDVRVEGELGADRLSITGKYSFPDNDGVSGQILATNGLGQISFVNPSSLSILTPTSILDGTGLSWTQTSPGILRGDVSLAPFSTSNLVEGSRLYFTNARADNRVAAVIANGTGLNWTYSGPGNNTLVGNITLAPFSTSNLAEGTNLYFTNKRVDDQVAVLLKPGTVGTGASPISWIYNSPLNSLTPVISLAPFSTSNLVEGSRLYFTNARAISAVAGALQNTSDITFSYNSILQKITANVVGLGSLTTSDLPEGINLYFTDQRVDTRVTTLIQDSSSIYWIYDSLDNSFIGNVILSLSDLQDVSIFSPGPSEGDVLYYDGVSWIASPGPALIAGDGIGSISTKDNSNSATGEYSAVLGGQNNIMDLDGAGAYGSNITAVDEDTFHVNNLNIYDPPQVDTTNFSVLVRGANGAIGQRFIGGLFAQTASSAPVTNTVTPTTIVGTGVGTLSVPENGFNIGDSFVAQVGGIISTGNGQTIQIRVFGGTGSTLLADTGVISLPNGLTNRPWDLYITFTVRALGAATTASIVSSGIFSYASANDLLGADFNTINDTTFDTTINNTLDVEVTWGATDASNSITTTQFVLTKIF